MEAAPDEALDPDLLAAVDNLDPIELLRRDLEDCLKEYSGIDLIVEILQNAIDAMDQRRYEAICQSAGLQPDSEEVIEAWNRAVMNLIEQDYEDYSSRDTAVQRGEYYENASDFETRREEWWEELGDRFEEDPDVLRTAANEYDPELTVRVRLGDSVWIEVEDSGTGIGDVKEVFKHKSSSKRVSRGSNKEKRLGVRGSHGWGLSAVLAMSDRVEVLTRSGDEAVEAYAFSNYSSFVSGDIASPSNERITIEDENPHLSSRLINNTDSRGTHIRVCLEDIEQDNQLGHTLLNYNHDKFENLLRMLTPVGQVNDYLLHPAFHVLRKGDLEINVETISEDEEVTTNIEFDIFRYSESSPGFASADFVTYVNSGWPSSTSVHTVHRTERGGDIYLVGAEIQDARELASEAESLLIDRNELPGKVNDDGEVEYSIQRGYHYAVSGGMKAEYLVKPPKSTTAAFRGFVLSETAQPTLGRKYVLDQRQSIAKAAGSHENQYDDVRRSVLPDSAPPVSSPAASRWRREFLTDVRDDVSENTPPSESLQTWAGTESREAMVMLVFGELLQFGVFGDLRILRAHLQEKYDFAFLYRGNVTSEGAPNTVMVNELSNNGWALFDDDGSFERYGIGEFKTEGDRIFDDFDPQEPRKSSDTIDLLICWNFDSEVVEDVGWIVEPSNPNNLEFQGQTHVWRPGGQEYRRPRNLAVVSLTDLIEDLIEDGTLGGPPSNWPDLLPEIYF